MRPQKDEPCVDCRNWDSRKGCTGYNRAPMLMFGVCARHEPKQPRAERDFIVHITRVERYEMDVRVRARNGELAAAKVLDAYVHDDEAAIGEKLTDFINVERQTYKPRLMKPGDKYEMEIKQV